MSLNQILLIGNAGRDAELRYTANGRAVANFSIAVNRRWMSNNEWQEETEWFNVSVWDSKLRTLPIECDAEHESSLMADFRLANGRTNLV